MTVPKGYRTNINVNVGEVGPEKRQEILDKISDRSTYLPKGVLEEDMDQTFIEFIDSDERMNLSIDGDKVPVIFLSIQKWSEFTKTWKFTDKYKNIEMPFITVVRKPDIQQGTNQAGLWNIPINRTYTYMKVPTWDGIRDGIDLYKIPQPTSVDMTYEVRFFTNKMKDLNSFNRIIQRAFQSKQCYINVNGHPMPLHLENIGDESNIDDFQNRRFYVQMFEIKLLGYILDEQDYEVVPTINRTMITTELNERVILNKAISNHTLDANVAVWNFLFKASSGTEFSFTSLYDLTLSELTEIVDINRIVIKVNGIGVFDGTVLITPLVIKQNDEITIKVYKNILVNGSFKLIGNTL